MIVFVTAVPPLTGVSVTLTFTDLRCLSSVFAVLESAKLHVRRARLERDRLGRGDRDDLLASCRPCTC